MVICPAATLSKTGLAKIAVDSANEAIPTRNGLNWRLMIVNSNAIDFIFFIRLICVSNLIETYLNYRRY